jgi:hypothetical protein
MTRVIMLTGLALGLLVGGLGAGKGNTPGSGEPVIQTEARCPLIYAPVICDHGKIYPNQCEADAHHAKNCVPYGI